MAYAPGNHSGFDSYLVDGVDDAIKIFIQYRVEIVLCDEILDFMNLALWTDGSDTLGHRQCFCLAKYTSERVDLPVNIRFDDHIEVNQCNLPDG